MRNNCSPQHFSTLPHVYRHLKTSFAIFNLLTDDEAWDRLGGSRRQLRDAQQDVSDEETDDVISLTPPVEHVMAGREQEARGEGGGEEDGAQGEPDGVEGESEVGCGSHGGAGQIAGGIEDVVVAGQDARRFWKGERGNGKNLKVKKTSKMFGDVTIIAIQ